MAKLHKIIPWIVPLLMAPWASADPFTTCPSQAFLAQGKPAVLYGVDLSTGKFNPLGDLNTRDKLNGMGFNYADGYLYAWYYEGQTLARILKDRLYIVLNWIFPNTHMSRALTILSNRR